MTVKGSRNRVNNFSQYSENFDNIFGKKEVVDTSKILKFEEGFRPKVYHCSEGYATIGFGTKICSIKGVDLKYYDELEITESVAEALLDEHKSKINVYLRNTFNLNKISPERYAILESMCYQLGTYGFSKFKNMIAAIKQGDWTKAADEALDSRWYKQTPDRAKRHAEVLRSGNLDAYKGLI